MLPSHKDGRLLNVQYVSYSLTAFSLHANCGRVTGGREKWSVYVCECECDFSARLFVAFLSSLTLFLKVTWELDTSNKIYEDPLQVTVVATRARDGEWFVVPRTECRWPWQVSLSPPCISFPCGSSYSTSVTPSQRFLGSSSTTSKCMKIRKHNEEIFFERIVERWCASLSIWGCGCEFRTMELSFSCVCVAITLLECKIMNVIWHSYN